MVSATSPETAPAATGRNRPQLSFWQIWNMCFGFMGIQFAFALQNSNVSRIFQSLGATLEQIPLLWIAAPLTGLLVQPLIGYWSDRTWTRLGRRRPFFLAGALLAAIALLAMPRSPLLLFAAVFLWILDASINIAMEPFRAFVGDQLAPAQRAKGYAMQSFFIGTGAVVAGLLPWLLAHAGVSNHATGTTGMAAIPDTVRYSFDIGALVLLLAVGWTVFRTREYPPDELRSFADSTLSATTPVAIDRRASRRRGLIWLVVGAIGFLLVRGRSWDQQLYLLCGALIAWGTALVIHSSGERMNAFRTMMSDFEGMPQTMRRLAAVQFFSWIALFALWIYTTPAVAQVHFGSTDPLSERYNQGANWVGVLFACYNGFAALAAMVIPLMVRKFGLRGSHQFNLLLGAAALLSMPFIRDPNWLLLPMVGIGFTWCSVLSLPYAMLSDAVPASKMGLYMGFFNFFIVIPQLLAATVLGVVLKLVFGGQPIYALVIGGVCFGLAALAALRIPQPGAR